MSPLFTLATHFTFPCLRERIQKKKQQALIGPQIWLLIWPTAVINTTNSCDQSADEPNRDFSLFFTPHLPWQSRADIISEIPRLCASRVASGGGTPSNRVRQTKDWLASLAAGTLQQVTPPEWMEEKNQDGGVKKGGKGKCMSSAPQKRLRNPLSYTSDWYTPGEYQWENIAGNLGTF